MTEPDVTLTDFALAIECMILCGLVVRANRQVGQGDGTACGRGRWLAIYFAAGCAASFFGGLVHGFFLNVQSAGHAIFWRATLLAVAVATLGLWGIGASLLRSRRFARWLIAAATIQCFTHMIVVLFWAQTFELAMMFHIPAVLFVLYALVRAFHRTRRIDFAVAVCGVIIMLAAGALQQLRISIHPVYFTHNALYHVVQMVALAVFYIGAKPNTHHERSFANVTASSQQGEHHVDAP